MPDKWDRFLRKNIDEDLLKYLGVSPHGKVYDFSGVRVPLNPAEIHMIRRQISKPVIRALFELLLETTLTLRQALSLQWDDMLLRRSHREFVMIKFGEMQKIRRSARALYQWYEYHPTKTGKIFVRISTTNNGRTLVVEKLKHGTASKRLTDAGARAGLSGGIVPRLRISKDFDIFTSCPICKQPTMYGWFTCGNCHAPLDEEKLLSDALLFDLLDSDLREYSRVIQKYGKDSAEARRLRDESMQTYSTKGVTKTEFWKRIRKKAVSRALTRQGSEKKGLISRIRRAVH